jgi:transposase
MSQPRTFEFIPIWNIPVALSYTMRRVECPTCGIKVETVPWAQGKHACCDVLRHFLARWARRLSWKETASCFHTSWDTVCRSVKWVVDFGLKHRDLENITAIGVDEVSYSKGHNYMTLVYQIDKGRKRLLGVIKDRETQSLASFFENFGAERCARIKVVCSDMWKPYLNVIARMLPAALNILDRFHIVKKLSEAVDEVRRTEVKQLKSDGFDPVLSTSRYCFLKRPENLTARQHTKLKDLLKFDLRSVRAYLLKESFDAFWQYNSPYWARWFLKKWCTRAMRSKLDPMKKFVKTLRAHEDLLMNYFIAGKLYSSGIVEGLNLRINLCMRKAYGYRSFDLLQTSLFHTLGDLPEPKFTHRFC